MKSIKPILFLGAVIGVFVLYALQTEGNDLSSSVQWHTWDEGVNASASSGKFLMVDVFTTWCGYCKKLDQTTYKDQHVNQVLAASFIAVKLNAESQAVVHVNGMEGTEQQWSQRMHVRGYPTIFFFDAQLRLVAQYAGYAEPQQFIKLLHYVQERRYTECTFDDYCARQPAGD